MTTTNKDIVFGDTVIPKGTPVIPSENLPTGNWDTIAYWAEPWPGMTEQEQRRQRLEGYGIRAEDVDTMTKGSTKALAALLREQDVSPTDWSDAGSHVSVALDACGMEISTDAHNESGDWGMMATYYSSKLHYTVILDWNMYQEFATLEELAKYLMEFEEMAHALEAKITMTL